MSYGHGHGGHGGYNQGGYNQGGYNQGGYGQAGHGQGGYGGQPSCPQGVDPSVFGWFQAVDQDRSGKISADELQRALLKNNMKQFNRETCRLMIGMFDKNKDGTIDIREFDSLWKYIQQWRQCFDNFDRDRSGNIDCDELHTALTTFGYRLSKNFSQMIVRTFDKTSAGGHHRRGSPSIDFDDFIQVCVSLHTLTDSFRAKDTNQSGQINIRYEEFLEMVLDNSLNII